MGHFSREEIEEIVRRLATYGKKDTEFETASDPSDDDIVAIVQDFENKKISLADIRRYFGAPYLPLDGSSAMEGDLDMGDHNIKNVADPSLSHHAANKDYVDGIASELDSEISNIDGRVQGIEDVIPSSVDPNTNQLADKAWVKAINDLVNYYKKSETYTQAEVNALIGSISQFHYDIVSTLPATGESNVLYLLGPKSGTSGDMYEEYVYSNGWVKIGDTSIDLSGYMPKSGGTFTGDVNIYKSDLYVRGQISVESGEILMSDPPQSDMAAINKGYVDDGLSGKQDTLIDSGAGKNFKKINGQSLLGSGDDIVISSVARGLIHNSTPLYIDLDMSPATFLLNGTDSSSGKEFCYLINVSDIDMGSETFDNFVLLSGDDVLAFTVGGDGGDGDIILQISASNYTWVNFMSLTSIAAEFYELQGSFTTSSQTVTPAILQQKLVSGTNIKTINSTSLLGSGDIQISADTSNCVKFGEAINASNGYLTIYGDETFALMLIVVLDDEVSTYIVRGNQSPTVSVAKIEGYSFQYAKRDNENGTLALYHEDSLTVTPILLFGTMPTITDLASSSGDEEEIPYYLDSNSLKTINNTSLLGSGNINTHPIPSGGTTGQVLAKASGTDYDVEWANGGGGGDTTDCVKYTQQSKTDNEKTTARTNIDAVGSPSINNIIELTQAEYDAITTKDQTAVYLVTDPSPSTESQNVGIANIETQSSSVSGGTNVTTITLTNGESYDIEIKNGEQGNTGSSVDYPYELVNNLTTNDATKGLSAAQGVVLEGEISQIGQDLAENTRAIDVSSALPGSSISSIQGYVAGTSEIKSTTADYYLYLYLIPKYCYYTIKKTSAPGPTFVIAGLVNSVNDFLVGGNLSRVLVLGDDDGTVTHQYYASEDTYLVVLGNGSNEARYCTAKKLTTKSVLNLLDTTNENVKNNSEKIAFLDDGFELKDTLSFTRAWINNAGVINASTNRVLSTRISGLDGVLSINTSGALSALDVIWVRILKGQTTVQAMSSWLSDKSLTIAFSEEYDYYIEIRKHTDAALTIEEIANVKIYFDKGDIISCNHEAISRLANMRRPFHNYSSSGTYNPCLTLAYFSDIHADTENIRRMSEFYVKYKWGLDDILQTGDLIASVSGGVPSNWNELGANILGIIGNHDAQNKVGGVWVTQPAIDSYNAVFAPFISNWGVIQPEGAAANGYCYWYKDYSGQKVRLIALDCMHWDSTQKNWFEGVLADAITNEMSVVVAVHYLPFEISDTDVPFDSLDFHPTSQSGSFIASTDIPNAISDFIGDGGEFICYLTGHVHIDLFGVGVAPYNNQLCISIATASHQDSATIYGDTERKAGTKSQDCINIVSFDTRTKTLKLYRIGADQDRYMRKKDFLSYNYSTHTVIR